MVSRLSGGHVEHASCSEYRGWALVEGHEELDVFIVVDGKVVAHCRADEERPDVVAAGYRSSRVGFSGRFSEPLDEGTTLAAFAVVPDGTYALPFQDLEGVVTEELSDVEPFAGFEGAVDYFGDDRVLGWAWMPSDPQGSVTIEAIADGELIASTIADGRRPDLRLAGRGTGNYGFEIEAAISDRCQLWMVAADRRVRLPIAVKTRVQADSGTTSLSGIRSHVDHLSNYEAVGWAYSSAAPGSALEVQASLGDRVIGRAIADQPRQDLLAHGIGTGNYGFKLSFSEPLQPGEVPVFTALQEAGTIETPSSINVIRGAPPTAGPATFEAFFSAHNRFTSQGPLYEDFDPQIFADLPKAKAPTVLAFYLPQFHQLDVNDKFWGTGFTEWRQLPRAISRFPGHYQPRIPRDLGFYNLTRLDDIHQQAKLALAAGVSAFAYYFYYFDGARVLERPLDALLASDIEMPFVLIWANENWTKTWDGSEREVLLKQSYRDADEDHLLETFANYLSDSRYLRIEGRPLLFIYNPSAIPETKATVRRWRRKLVERHDLNPLIFMCQTFGAADPAEYDLDGAMEFPPHKIAAQVKARPVLDAYSSEFTGQVVSYDDFVDASLSGRPVGFPLIKTAVPSWDNDARRPGRGYILEDCAPAKYEDWLAELIRRAHKNSIGGRAVVAVNAWNEWAESAYLEPDVYYGAAYLNATARAIVRGTTAAESGELLATTTQGEQKLGVSAIVPNFNHAEFIEERLASIIHQTRAPDEIIFLDDASTDGSLEIATRILQNSGIPYKVHANAVNSGSVFKQWIKGLALASHPLIWMAESDDTAAESLLANLLPAFNDPSVMMAYGRIIPVDREGQELGDLQHYLDDVDNVDWHASSTTPAAKLFERDFILKNIVPNASGAIFKRPKLSSIELDDLCSYRFAGDWYFYAKVLRGGSLAYRHRARSYFRISQSSASRDALRTAAHIEDHEKVLRALNREYGLNREGVEAHLDGLRAHLPETAVSDLRRRLADLAEGVNARPLRICVAAHGFAVGGGEAVPIALANALKDAGHHVTFLIVDGAELRAAGSLFDRLRPDIPIVLWDDVGANFDAFVADYGLDIFNSHNISVDSRLARAGAQVGVPYVIGMHGGYENSPEYVDDELVEFVASKASKIVLLAEKNRAGLDKRGVPEAAFVKGFNALPNQAQDLDFLTRADLGLAEDDFVIAQFSRAIEAKGWQVAIDAVTALNRGSARNYVLLLGGDGPDRAAIMERNADAASVVFLGAVQNPAAILPVCDLSVLPTTYVGETFPLAILESFSSGVPVVTTDVGEIPTIMMDRGEGVPGKVLDHTLEAAELSNALATAIAEFAEEPNTRRSMNAAAVRASQTYSMSNLVAFYEDLFRDVIATNVRPTN